MDEAESHFLRGIRIQEQTLSQDRESLAEEQSLADCYLEFGKALVRQDRSQASIPNLEKAIAGYARVWEKDTHNLLARHRIANAQRFLVDALSSLGQHQRARDNYDAAHKVFQELTETDPENIDWQQDLAMSYQRLGELALRTGDSRVAAAHFQAAHPIFEKTGGKFTRKRKAKSRT